LLRTSLEPEVDKKPVVGIVNGFVPDAEVVSDAGTELSIRLPLDAVGVFPNLFQQLETQGRGQGVLSFGIETTTLEEVFMNIVNEDPSYARKGSQEQADKMIGAVSVERRAMQEELKKMDSKKFPLSEADIKTMLTKGATTFDFRFSELVRQTANMLDKRRAQYWRSKGQRIFVTVFPTVVAILFVVCLYNVPSEVTADDPGATYMQYDEYFTTPIAATTEEEAASYAQTAGIDDFTYVGSSYDELYGYIFNETAGGIPGLSTYQSSDGLFFSGPYNFTLMYNATLPLNYPALVSDVINAMTLNATNGGLNIELTCQPFPVDLIGDQVRLVIIYYNCILF
jgi:hypothetical protein